MAYKYDKEAAAQKREQQVNEGMKIIEEEVPGFYQSEKWKNYLSFVSNVIEELITSHGLTVGCDLSFSLQYGKAIIS